MYKLHIIIFIVFIVNKTIYSQPTPIYGNISLQDKCRKIIFNKCYNTDTIDNKIILRGLSTKNEIFDSTLKYKVVVKRKDGEMFNPVPIACEFYDDKTPIMFSAYPNTKLSVYIFRRFSNRKNDTMEIKIDSMMSFYLDIKFKKGKFSMKKVNNYKYIIEPYLFKPKKTQEE